MGISPLPSALLSPPYFLFWIQFPKSAIILGLPGNATSFAFAVVYTYTVYTTVAAPNRQSPVGNRKMVHPPWPPRPPNAKWDVALQILNLKQIRTSESQVKRPNGRTDISLVEERGPTGVTPEE